MRKLDEVKAGDELLRLENVKKYYPANKAVFKKDRKSTLGQTILCLEKATAGKIIYRGVDITTLKKEELRELRKEIQIIFQDPYSSLNPKMTVGSIIAEPMVIHHMGSAAQRDKRVGELLELVGLRPEHAKRYPHEFSGGQRQRVGIARALAMDPKLIICDEAVSALDVSIQAQVLNLLRKLQKELGLTYIFIAHGLSIVKHISNRVGVMYLGKLVELAEGDSVYKNALHPYTRALISAIPEPDPEKVRQREILVGDVPSPVDPPGGCRFHTRCPHASERCRQSAPEFRDVGGGHFAACHLIK